MYSVIMAGGIGKRFWPRSRKNKPKQLLDIISDEKMLRLTFNRVKKISDLKKIYVVAGQNLYRLIRDELKELPEKNILVEPSGKSTAPCIGLAATVIAAKDSDAVMGVFPADHLIEDEDKFVEAVKTGHSFAKDHVALVTFGITPTRPITGYGYIQFEKGGLVDCRNIFKVKTFAEKPNLETAKRFLKSGDFLWNSGMFIWKIPNILNAMKLFLPDMHESLEKISDVIDTPRYKSALKREWATIHSISIDYGVMEKAKNVYVVKSDFRWNDVGSWDSVYDIVEKDKNGNVLIGNTKVLNTKGCYIYSDKHLVGAIEVENLIIVQTKDALLVVKRNESEKVKDLVDLLIRENYTDYL
jgi:mannose-1-phosphate guanylyltransferase